MPILKHAKKKLKQDKNRTLRNKKVKTTFKALVKKAKEVKSAKSVSEAFSGIDKAAKNRLIHKNKAARMKSSLSKLIGGTKTKTAESKTAKPKTAAKAKPAAKTKTTIKKSSSKKSPKK